VFSQLDGRTYTPRLADPRANRVGSIAATSSTNPLIVLLGITSLLDINLTGVIFYQSECPFKQPTVTNGHIPAAAKPEAEGDPPMAPSVYDVITERIVQKLEQGTVPWRRPWAVEAGAPRNIRGTLYRGVNVFLLGCQAYESPYWMTYRQARELGGSVKR